MHYKFCNYKLYLYETSLQRIKWISKQFYQLSEIQVQSFIVSFIYL